MMSASIISILRIAAAVALLPLAALACAAPTSTVAPTATPPREGDEPDCSPYPYGIMAVYALCQSGVR